MQAQASVGRKVPKTPRTPTSKSKKTKKSNRKPRESQGVLPKTGMGRNKAIELHGHVIADISAEIANLEKERDPWKEDLAKLLKKAKRMTYNDSMYDLRLERKMTSKETVTVKRHYDGRNEKDKKAGVKAREASKHGKS